MHPSTPSATEPPSATDPLRAIPPVVRTLLLLVVFAQLGDAVTFALGSQMIGIGAESNGLITTLYRHGGLDAVLLLKGAAIMLTLAVLTVLARRVPRAFAIGAAVAIGLGFLGLLSNTTTVAGLIG